MLEFIGLLGGFWFFCLVLLILFSGIFSAEFDSLLGAFITFCLLLTALNYAFDVRVFSFIANNPASVVGFGLAYVLVGIAYAVVYRYGRWLKSESAFITANWKEYSRNHKQKHGTEPTVQEFRKSGAYRKFRPSNNKDIIASWISLWPWAIFWDLLNRPIRFVYRNSMATVNKSLDYVGERVTEKIIGDNK